VHGQGAGEVVLSLVEPAEGVLDIAEVGESRGLAGVGAELAVQLQRLGLVLQRPVALLLGVLGVGALGGVGAQQVVQGVPPWCGPVDQVCVGQSLQGWLLRSSARALVVEIDGDRLELVGATSEERRRLTNAWLSRHERVSGEDMPEVGAEP
jgi:hypothetical protein